MEPQNLVTQAEYARLRGVQRQYINKKIRQGVIKVYGDKKRVAPHEADAALKLSADPARQMVNEAAKEGGLPLVSNARNEVEDGEPQVNDSNIQNYTLHRATREKYQAEKSRLEYEERVGILVRRSDIEREMFIAMRELRNRILELPQQMALRLISMNNEREILRFLEEKLMTVLDQAAQAIEVSSSEETNDA